MSDLKNSVEKILGQRFDGDCPKAILTSLQDAKDEIVFYRLRSPKQIDLLKKRMPKGFNGLLVTTLEVSELKNTRVIVVSEDQFIEVQNQLLDLYYPFPAGTKVLGVTGTNGKTSTCWFLSELLKKREEASLYLGTIGVYLNGEKLPEEIQTTTPSRVDLRRLVFKYLNSFNESFLILEVSSHALDQERLGDIKLQSAGWLSFSQDHLDYHQNLEEYFKAKMKIFNLLDQEAKLFVPKSQESLLKKIDHPSSQQSENFFEGKGEIESFFRALYNQENFSIAFSMLEDTVSGLKVDISDIRAVPGRFECIEKEERIMIIDYAHTPDALMQILRSARSLLKSADQKLWCVFGCGGDRDRSKRKEMGKAVNEYADEIVVTSDNPRSEDPRQIIDDTLEGVSKSSLSFVDRREAIVESFKRSSAGDVIVIAGKGHEEYQEINGVKNPFSDRRVVENL